MNNRRAIAWRWTFPPKIQREMATLQNPCRTLLISNFEMAGTIGQANVLTQHTPVEGKTIHIFCDNTPVLVSWQTKRSTTTVRAAAQLLQLSAAHQRTHCYHLKIQHLAGKLNNMVGGRVHTFNLLHLNCTRQHLLASDLGAIATAISQGVTPNAPDKYTRFGKSGPTSVTITNGIWDLRTLLTQLSPYSLSNIDFTTDALPLLGTRLQSTTSDVCHRAGTPKPQHASSVLTGFMRRTANSATFSPGTCQPC